MRIFEPKMQKRGQDRDDKAGWGVSVASTAEAGKEDLGGL